MKIKVKTLTTLKTENEHDMRGKKEIAKIKEKAKKLRNTKHEPYTSQELMKWAGVIENRKNVPHARNKAEDSWLRFIRVRERELRTYVRALLLKSKNEHEAIAQANKWLDNRSRLRGEGKTTIVRTKIECIVIDEFKQILGLK